MFGNGEAGEGIGYIRPVYDGDYWNNPPDGFGWIKEYRFGGGAGVWNDTPSHDTDTRDPNAIDVIVGCGQTQAQVLDWRAASPVAAADAAVRAVNRLGQGRRCRAPALAQP